MLPPNPLFEYLVCPRCRHIEGSCVYAHPLRYTSAEALDCSNPHCNRRYPIIDGVVLLLAAHSTQLINPLLWSNETREAALGADPALLELETRLASYAWTAFHDHLALPGPKLELPVHLCELLSWAEQLGAVEGSAATLSAGAALGREAWLAQHAPLVLLDAHLPSLLASRRLATEGCIELFFPVEAGRFERVRLELPHPPSAEQLWVCADIHDPPFRAEAFSRVLAANLLDSVARPHIALGQLLALAAPEGHLILSSPFTWRDEITESALRFSAYPGVASSLEGLCEDLAALAPERSLLGQRDFLWALRMGARQLSLYQSVGLVLGSASSIAPL
ncbi:MAG: hypothetical protein RBU37_07055 [Myxococcota bacterium]|nr:hypothetical protein [Myxococcota bacterium]